MTARKLVRPRRRFARGNELLSLVGDSEFMASLSAAGFEDVATGFRGHSFAEAVVIFAFTV